MKWILILLLAFTLLLAGCSTVQQFEYPDIKDDFCGAHINFQYCKCAFHNDYCDSIGLDKRSANTYVNAEYDAWVAEQLADWLEACASTGGIPGVDDCEYCDEGMIAKDGQCVDMEDNTIEYEDTSAEFVPDAPLRKDCTVDPAQFNDDWKKYSDIDEAIDFGERSYEAKQALTTYDEMIDKMIEAFALERDIEIESQMQVELEEYRSALVQNIQTNLLKAFWRLSWVTYSTVKSGSGLGKSYANVLTTGASAQSIGAGLKVVQGIIPKNSALAINTSTVGGKATSVGAKVAISAVDSLGNPAKVATALFKSASDAALPSADISQEELNILRDQHLDKGVIDDALAESRAENMVRQTRLEVLEKEIADLQDDIASWEFKEKTRVQLLLESSCEELKEQFENE